jgi:hypothetical protein
MKNGEGVALTVELERRLRQSTDRLRDVRETLEELSQAADALQYLFSQQQMQANAQAAAPSTGTAPTARAQKAQPAAAYPPAKASRPAASSAPSAPSEQDEVPEWRKLFPKLSAQVPGHGK